MVLHVPKGGRGWRRKRLDQGLIVRRKRVKVGFYHGNFRSKKSCSSVIGCYQSGGITVVDERRAKRVSGEEKKEKKKKRKGWGKRVGEFK